MPVRHGHGKTRRRTPRQQCADADDGPVDDLALRGGVPHYWQRVEEEVGGGEAERGADERDAAREEGDEGEAEREPAEQGDDERASTVARATQGDAKLC